MQRSHSTRTSHPLAHHHPSSSSYNENPPIPLTRPKTSILLPCTTITSYPRLLSLPPSSPLLQQTLTTLPPSLLKKPYRKSFIPSFLYSTPIFQFFLERARYKLSPSECCSLCPLHSRLLEAPLVHLMGLVGYEMYTHLQSLMAMHPSQRSGVTNSVLEKLHPWREKRFCEPGSRVRGCLACELGRLYQDFGAMEALSVVAKSGRRSKGMVQLVDEGWVGWWGDGSRGVKEVREDRRRAMRLGRGDNAKWRGGMERTTRGEVEWKEKRGFVLSSGASAVERSVQSQRHVTRNEVERPARSNRPAHSQRYSLRDDKPVLAEPPMRPDRPKGLTLSMVGKHGDRVGGAPREAERTIKRKPVPGTDDDDKNRERKTLSTATTVVGSPKIPRLSTRHSHQPAAEPATSSKAIQHGPGVYSRAVSEVRPVPPPSSIYSRTQGFRSAQPKNILGARSARKQRNANDSQSGDQQSHHRIPSTQQTRWSHFRGSNVTEPSTTAQELQRRPRIPSTQQTRWSAFQASNVPVPSTTGRHEPALNPPSVPRRTKTMHAIGRKVAAGEYEWWNSDYSDSEDEKVVVPSLERSRKTSNGGAESDNSDSDYEVDEDEEEIRQRYLDEHEALLRMAQGKDYEVPQTRDYLDTLPDRLVESTIPPMWTGARAQHDRSLKPSSSARPEMTIRRERSARR
ncbi:MAG: hypothetical protein Q9209_006237 [Squamulea sp. 1 TL-2023]